MAGASEYVLRRNGGEEEEIGGDNASARRSSASNPPPPRAIRFHPANIFIPIFSPPIPPSFTFRRPELCISSDSESDSSSDCAEEHVSPEIASSDAVSSHSEGRGEISSNVGSDLPSADDRVSGFSSPDAVQDSGSGIAEEEDPLFVCRRGASGDGKLSTSQNSEGSGMSGSRSHPNADSDDEEDIICVISRYFDDLLEPDQVAEELSLPDGWDYIGSGIGEDRRVPGVNLEGEDAGEILDFVEEDAYYNFEFEVFSSADEFDEDIPDEVDISDAFRDAIKHLSSISLTEIDVAENRNLCAICKVEIFVGEELQQLPCLHHYHPACIFPWLRIKSTCPLCRFELLADEPDLRGSFAMVASVVD